MHGPICELPSFRPTNIHVFSTNNDYYQVNPVKAYAGAEARSSSWSHSRLDTINASLAEHQVCVVPLVSSPIAISVLLDGEKFSSYKLLELRNLHSCSRKLSDIKSCGFIIVVGKSMRRVILTALEAQLLSEFVHLLQEVQYFRMVPELR